MFVVRKVNNFNTVWNRLFKYKTVFMVIFGFIRALIKKDI